MSVKIGQVYSETDPRQAGRTVEVMALDPTHAKVRLNTPARNVGRNAIGRHTRIRLDRLAGPDYELSDVEPHRFGTHKETGELGYYPRSELRDRTFDPVLVNFTRGELVVLRELMKDGADNFTIGSRLYLGVNTIKMHLRRAMRKVGVHNRAALVLYLAQRRVIPVDNRGRVVEF